MGKMRCTITPAVAGTYYPTGRQLGVKAPAGATPLLNDITALTSTTATDSFFAQDGNDPTLPGRNSKIWNIRVISAGSAATATIESHAGSTLIPIGLNLAAPALSAPIEVGGGWRITIAGTTAPQVMIEWEDI